jgi:hypothetical protein
MHVVTPLPNQTPHGVKMKFWIRDLKVKRMIFGLERNVDIQEMFLGVLGLEAESYRRSGGVRSRGG